MRSEGRSFVLHGNYTNEAFWRNAAAGSGWPIIGALYAALARRQPGAAQGVEP